MIDLSSKLSHQKSATVVSSWRRIAFHPLTVMTASLLAASLFALLVTIRFEGDFRVFLLYYFLPIGIPFVAYIFDRVENWHDSGLVRWGIDLLVLGWSLARAFVGIPFISGHALFLTYALLSTRSWMARILALIVMFQVIYLKLFVWQDITLLGGIALGCIAGICFQSTGKMKGQVKYVV